MSMPRLRDDARRPTGATPGDHEIAQSNAQAAVQRSQFRLIEESHQRCAALGLSRIERPDHTLLARNDLAITRDRNLRLHSHAAPVMELLLDQIRGTESMIVLTDALGTVVHAVGDDDFLTRADKVALAPGANWAEQSKGTNAIGTALFEEAPTLVHANQHYMHANHFLTCSAVPIFDPRGAILGILDVSGDHRSYHQHTMGLVRMSARMIENHWLSDDCSARLRLHFHGRVEFIGSLLEGILVVGPDGRILGSNRSALDLLSLSAAALRMQSLTTLLGTTVSAVMDHFRSTQPVPMRLQLANGEPVYVSARFNWVPQAFVPAHPVDESAPVIIEPLPGVVPRESGAREPALREPAAPRLSPKAAQVENSPHGLEQLLTGDARVDAVVAKVRRVLDRNIPMLILGETGTGKEWLARALHQDSHRASRAFVAVNCASIPETLIESELFGYEEGAFTGARRRGAPGSIVQANGGTLLLDEIGDMPLALQARLLRVLQERQVKPLGSQRAIAVDIAVIGATHRDLRELIDAGQFREDLYYRLNGLSVRLPPLRERSDLAVLCERILRHEKPLGTPPRLSPSVLALFRRHTWPGNIRQLTSVLRVAVVMAGDEPVITEAHLGDDFLDELRHTPARAAPALSTLPHRAGPSTTITAASDEAHLPDAPGTFEAPTAAAATAAGFATAAGAPATDPLAAVSSTPGPAQPPDGLGESDASEDARAPRGTARRMTMREAERETIRAALEAANGNISVASRNLGICRNTIYRKLFWKKNR